MQYLEREDIHNICREIAKKVFIITQDKNEVEFILEKVIDLVNDDGFSFSEVENLITFIEEIKRNGKNVKLDSIVDLYIDRILKTSRTMENDNIRQSVLMSQTQKLSELTGISQELILKDSLSGKILDSIVPIEKFNFKVIFEENMQSFIVKMQKIAPNDNDGERE